MRGWNRGLERRATLARAASILGAAVVLVALAAACAPKPVTAPSPGPARYPDFLFPQVPEDLQKRAGAAVPPHELAWRALQAGDARAAERGFTGVLKSRADFYPAEAGLAYVDLARGNDALAAQRFNRVLQVAPAYVPALVGKGQAELKADRPDEALAAFEAALAIDPSLSDVRSRVEALRFKRVDAALTDARRAEQAGNWEAAREAYAKASTSSPDSAFLYRDLARVERQLGRGDDAVAHARRAAELDPSDPAAFVMLAEMYEARGEWDAAVAAMSRAQDLEGTPEAQARTQSLRDRAAIARLPAEYRAIGQSDRLTRGELAALVGVRFEPLLREAKRTSTAVVTDVRGYWAQPWIMAVARARIMEVFDNHTFQPRAAVRRGDLAKVVSRLLGLIGQRAPALAKTWSSARPAFDDIGAGNLYYQAAAMAVAAGIMKPDGSQFQAGRVVSGAEAIDAVTRLEQLAARTSRDSR